MSTIFIRFGLDLEDYSDPSPLRNHGPLFHRWLPDGESDAVKLAVGHARYSLKVWFERGGFVRNGWIEYQDDRHEVDETLLAQQGSSDAGPLSGLLKVDDPPEAAFTAIRTESIGDDVYIEFAQHIVDEILQPRLSYFLDTLRIRFGQHWIRPLEPWDSRQQTLGSYCQRLNMRWSETESDPWLPFRPDEPQSYANLTVVGDRHFRELVTRDDWFGLDGIVALDTPFTLGETVLLRAHALLDQGQLRFSLIESTTALEVAVSERFRTRLDGSNSLLEDAAGFNNLSLGAKLLTLVPDPQDQVADLELAIEAINRRHEIVHEGNAPPANARQLIRSLLAVTAALLPRDDYRFPQTGRANARTPSDKWQEIYAEEGFAPLTQDLPDA